ncbi:hypothetical protein HT031_003745 [Scenedesmus sp. PABB004]|nr:hypothetical protein HT031_003745 [Scenedesmus sp. PABB004]
MEAEAAAQAARSGAAAAAGGRPPDEVGAVLSTIFGGDESPVVISARKFNKIAERNWGRMKATAGQAYAATLKPIIDRLSGDQ